MPEEPQIPRRRRRAARRNIRQIEDPAKRRQARRNVSRRFTAARGRKRERLGQGRADRLRAGSQRDEERAERGISTPTPSPQSPQAPSSSPRKVQQRGALPFNAAAERTIGGLRTAFENTQQAIGAERNRTERAFGLAAGFQSDNPYSRAALLQRQFNQAREGNKNSLAARGQFLSGAMNRAEANTLFQRGQQQNVLERQRERALAGLTAQEAAAAATRDEGIETARWRAMRFAAENPPPAPADVDGGGGGEGPAPASTSEETPATSTPGRVRAAQRPRIAARTEPVPPALRSPAVRRFNELDPQQRMRRIQQMDPEKRQRFMAQLSPERRQRVRKRVKRNTRRRRARRNR